MAAAHEVDRELTETNDDRATVVDGLAEVGLPGDPIEFKVLGEIDIIAHLATNYFQSLLPQGMTPAQFGVLNRLARLQAAETISEIATAFQVTQPTMSSTMKKLHDKGYVRFNPDPDDARRKVVAMTKDGAAARRDVMASLAPRYAEFGDAFPDLEWSDVLPKLMKLRAFLEKQI